MDKSGGFIGYMFVQGERGMVNMSVALVEQGLAKVHFTAEKGNYYSPLCAAEEHAKNVGFSKRLHLREMICFLCTQIKTGKCNFEVRCLQLAYRQRSNFKRQTVFSTLICALT